MSAKADKFLSQFGANISQTVAPRAGQAPLPASAPPDKYAGAVRNRMFAELPVDAIVCNLQVRTEFDPGDLERLASSLKRFGQLAPIRVRHDPERNAWVVLVGERRLRACRLAGIEKVRVEFVERDLSEADILAEQVVENVVRADLQPVEQGRSYKRLMGLNDWTALELSEALGIEQTAVYRALSLLKLPDDVAAKVDAGEIKATAAYEISKLQIADDQREVAERVLSEGLDHAATVATVNAKRKAHSSSRGKGKGSAKAGPPRPRTFRLASGKVTVEPKKIGGLEAMLAMAEEVVEAIRSELGARDQEAA